MLDRGGGIEVQGDRNSETDELSGINYIRHLAQVPQTKLNYKKVGNRETFAFHGAHVEVVENERMSFSAKNGKRSHVYFHDGKITGFTEPDGTDWLRANDELWVKDNTEVHAGKLDCNAVEFILKEDNGLIRKVELYEGHQSIDVPRLSAGEFINEFKSKFNSIDKNHNALISKPELVDYCRKGNLSATEFQVASILMDNYDQFANVDRSRDIHNQQPSYNDVKELQSRYKNSKDLNPLISAIEESAQLACKDFVLYEGKHNPYDFQSSVHFLKADLSKRFGVAFPEHLRRWSEIGCPNYTSRSVPQTRQPKMHELIALKAALEHTAPSQLRSDSGNGTNFFFLKQEAIPALCAFQTQDIANGNLVIAFQPNFYTEPPLAIQQTLAGEPESESQEADILHELAHSGQRRRRIHLDVTETSPSDIRIANVMGWTIASRGNYTTWLLNGKSGELYENLRGNPGSTDMNNSAFLFRKWNDLQQFQTANTKVEQAQRILPASEVRNLAKVKPITEYFTTPWEMEAEGECFLKLGAEGRQKLIQNSPPLYRHVKEEDQQQIDTSYRLGMRAVDGQIVQNTEKNRQAVRQFEARFGLIPKEQF